MTGPVPPRSGPPGRCLPSQVPGAVGETVGMRCRARGGMTAPGGTVRARSVCPARRGLSESEPLRACLAQANAVMWNQGPVAGAPAPAARRSTARSRFGGNSLTRIGPELGPRPTGHPPLEHLLFRSTVGCAVHAGVFHAGAVDASVVCGRRVVSSWFVAGVLCRQSWWWWPCVRLPGAGRGAVSRGVF